MGKTALLPVERVALGFTLVVELATLVFCLVTRPSPASLLAPVLGPWAGYVHGHEHCTMATVLPVPSWAALASLVLAGGALLAARDSRARPLAVGYLSLSLVAWCALTVLSVANSLE